MAVDGVNGTNSSSNNTDLVAKDKIGFAGLTSESFLKLLITQLQNQDPTEPVGNEELLSQLSMMRNLQSNIEMGDTLKAITSNQQLSNASAFIGKRIEGVDTEDNQVSGIVTKAFLQGGEAFVAIGDVEVSFGKVSSVTPA